MQRNSSSPPTLEVERNRLSQIQQAIAEFLLDGRARQFTKTTLDHYSYRLEKFSSWLSARPDPITELDAITPNAIRLYLIHLQDRGLASNTQHTEARAIRAFLNFCVREELLAVSPFSKVKMPRKDIIEKTNLSNAEINRLIQACESARDKALVMTLLDTGLRSSELCALNLANLDGDTGEITVIRGKGRKDRRVYLSAKTLQQVRRYLRKEQRTLDPKSPLFASHWHGSQQRLTRSGLYRILKAVGTSAGVNHSTPHEYRRTFAINCLRAGMNIYAVARLMGHADIDTLKAYLHYAEADLQAAHEHAGLMDNVK